MAGAQFPPNLKFPGWPGGIRNRGREEALTINELQQQTTLRRAVNIDLDDMGKPQRRPGTVLTHPMPGIHSLWAHPRFPYLLAVHNNALTSFDETLDDEIVYGLEAAPLAPMAYALGADDAYFTNGVDAGQVQPNGLHAPWCTECPNGQPLAQVDTAMGGLDAGTYQVAITFVDANARESGATLPIEIDVPTGGGIRLGYFPTPQTAGPTWIRIYCSHPNGDVLYYVTGIPVGTANFLVGAHPSGAALDKLFLSALPAGQVLAFHAARVHVGVANLHMWGEPMMQGLTNITRNWTRYDANITLIAPAGQAASSGMFVSVAAGAGRSAGRTYFLSDPDPTKAQRVIAHPHGAVPGSLTVVDAKALGLDGGELPAWLADNGQIVVGSPDGKVMQLHETFYVGPERAESASLAMRERDGLRHLVAVLRGGTDNKMASSDTVDAEVWRNGIRQS